ncbi:nucleoside triphosphate pyrophosphohydrolase [Streptomyces sp. NPDC093249]|uniref:nucleoside triphosphate pyrophosphohydrolase n=1 Tax=unclassified Streptomyces TaxID=2593676 RepID=UPI0034501279
MIYPGPVNPLLMQPGTRPQRPSKLVRDRIPQIIRERGATPDYYIASPAEYRTRLRAKLAEEVSKFLGADGQPAAEEELADVLEVVLALAADLGITPERLEATRAAKATSRGAFAERIILAS